MSGEMDHQIERAVEADGSAIHKLTAAAGVFSPEELDCVAELWQDYLDHGKRSGYIFLVCRAAEEIQGYACFGPTALTKGTFDLYWIAVDPHSHGRGIGRALLTQVEAEVRARGGHLLLIETSNTPAYASARRLYERAGCTREAVIRDFYAIGDDLVLYSIRL